MAHPMDAQNGNKPEAESFFVEGVEARPADAPVESGESQSRQLHALRLFQDAFVESFTAAARKLLGDELRIRPDEVKWSRLGDFLTCCGGPRCYRRLATEAPGPAGREGVPDTLVHLVLSPPAAYAMIDRLLGGSGGQIYVPDRPATGIERQLMRRMSDLAAAAVCSAWPGRETLKLRADDDSPDQPMEPATRTQVAAASFEITLDGSKGSMRLGFEPALAAELSKSLPDDGPTSIQREKPDSGKSHDARAQTTRAAESFLELSATVADTVVGAGELAGLATGDLLTTDAPADGEVIVRVAGIPRFAARLGRCHGRRAITITRRMGNQPEAD